MRIFWIPVLDSTGLERGPDPLLPLTTFGRTIHDTVPVPGVISSTPWQAVADGTALIDREIAGLVALLSQAGVRTFQSCQDAGDPEGMAELDLGPHEALVDDESGMVYLAPADDLRYGCIMVEWAEFPRLAPLLPVRGDDPATSGWLFSASPNARYVSILFPWADLDKFTTSVRAAT